VVAACIAIMALTWVGPNIVLTAGLTVLLVSGVLTTEQALAGFAKQGMLTVAVLYVVVSGLTEAGAVAWFVQRLLGRPRGLRAAQMRLMSPTSCAWASR
jgi:hypothetical protein